MSADYSDTLQLQKRLSEASEAITAMSSDLAIARQVREYDSDRRKKALAKVAAPLLVAGESSAAADTKARASDDYHKSMTNLGAQLQGAELVVARYEAHKIQFECARSLLSIQKATMNQL